MDRPFRSQKASHLPRIIWRRTSLHQTLPSAKVSAWISVHSSRPRAQKVNKAGKHLEAVVTIMSISGPTSRMKAGHHGKKTKSAYRELTGCLYGSQAPVAMLMLRLMSKSGIFRIKAMESGILETGAGLNFKSRP